MTEQEKEKLANTIAGHLMGVHRNLQIRQSALFYKADKDYGARVAKGLGLNISEIKKLANMPIDEQHAATA